MKSNLKKVLAGILALCMVVGGIYYVAPEAKEVQAEATEETEEHISYTTEEYTEDESGTVQGYLTNKTVIESNDNPGWLFAGWFTDEYCTTPVTTAVEGTTYHAKFVDPGVLNVKLQITDGTEDGSPSTNMRLVTSVDSLSYAEVGFEVYYGEEDIENKTVTQKVPIQKVFKRIVASSTSGVDYNYSPKVVDTDSEYFATATLINIANGNFEKPFYIKPYWITNGGATVYGTSRYVTIKGDALSTVTTVNVPVKIADADTYIVTNASDTSNTAITNTEAYHDGTYAHLRIAKTAVESSLTKFNVSDGTNSAVAYHRNLETTYAPSGTDYDAAAADKTWYTACDSTETEYVIATTADLYALPGLSNEGVTFKNRTIYVIADIVANTGIAGVNGWTASEGQTAYRWTPVGNEKYAFQGRFDGQGHTISGLYTNASLYYNGFFGNVYDADFKNFTLENSIFKSTNITNTNDTPTASGTIVANGKFIMENIHSNANISNVAHHLGGLAGRATHESSVKNCWYSGTVYSRATSGNVRTGGLIGYLLKGTNVIENCLFTGKINIQGGGARFGGFVGDSNPPIDAYVNMTDCLSAGTITVKSDVTATEVGAIAGRANGDAITINNVFATTECYELTAGSDANARVTGAVPQISTSSLNGLLAFHATSLDYQATWSLREGDVPVQKVFADSDYEITNDIKADKTWYTAEEGKTEYEIASAEQLYGLAILVNDGEDFEGITVKLTSNINLNEGWNGELKIVNGGPVAPEEPVNEWIPIGTSTNMFKGTFEGNGKVISGLYIDKQIADSNGIGLFGNVYNVQDETQMCTIQNFAIDNSYIYTRDNTSSYIGGLVGKGEANINNVYCDVDIYGVNSSGIGGILGRIDGGSKDTTLCKIKNCWYDGTIALRTGSAIQLNSGGFIGYICYGINNTMEHCLFTGEINYNNASDTAELQPRLGGFIGRNNSTSGYISILDSLSAGSITCTTANEAAEIKEVGSVLGAERGTSSGVANYLKISNVFVSIDYTVPAVVGSASTELTEFKDSTGNATTIIQVEDWDGAIGSLDSEYWAPTETIPVLRNLTQYTTYQVLP